MKWPTKMLIPLAAATSMIFAFTACDKKIDDSQNLKAIRGNVNTDGINVLSSSTLNGKPISLSISNVTKISEATNNGSLMYGYTNNKAVVNMDIAVNGINQRVSLYNSIYGESFKSQLYINGFVVYYESRCVLNTNCNDFLINTFTGDQSSINRNSPMSLNQVTSAAPDVQWKQIALLKTFSNNSVGAVFEITSGNAGLLSTDQALQSLMMIRANP